ncbi:MAG: MMPL family transporter [Spirochaetales bacterium]|nr:MMPL family transporter [Spirochaetales bacterium]
MRRFDKIIMSSTKRPVTTVIIILVVSLLFVPGLIGFKSIPFLQNIEILKNVGGLVQDNSNKGYLGDLSKFNVESEYVDEVFGRNRSTLFVSVEGDNIYSYDALHYVYTLHKALENIEGVEDCLSIINVEDVTGVDDEIKSYSLIAEDPDGSPLIPSTEEDLASLRREVESNEMFETNIYSKVRNAGGIPIAWNISFAIEETQTRSTDFINHIEKVITRYKDPRYKVYLFGGDVLSREVDNSGLKDLAQQMPLIILVICFIYFLNFRSFRGVVFPIVGNILAALWTYSIIGYAGIKLAFIHLLLMPLLIALGSSYAIHLLNQYYREAHNYTKENKNTKIGLTIKHILKTIILAGLTTMIGLSSNIINRLVHLKTFGIFASIGVLFSVIMALTFIPALLTLMKSPKQKNGKKFTESIFDKLIDKLNLMTVRHKYIIFFVVLAIVGMGIIGTFFVSNEIANTDYFAKEHKIRFLTNYFSENFDGVETMSIIIDTNPAYEYSAKNEIERKIKESKKTDKIITTYEENMKAEQDARDASSEANVSGSSDAQSDPFETDLFGDTGGADMEDIFSTDIDDFKVNPETGKALNAKFLKKVESLMAYAESLDGVGKAYSFINLQKRFNFIMHNDDPAYDVIPDTDQEIISYTESFGGSDDNFDGLPDTFENMIDPAMNIVKITLKLKNIGTRDITTGDEQRIRTKLDNYIVDNFISEKDSDEPDIYYFFSGGSITFMTIQNYIVYGQIISIIFSLIAIAIITSILFKSVKTGCISIIPLGVAVIMNFGVMGIFGIKLDIATSLIASFAIGIGIDDTIHFLLNLRKQIKHHKVKPGATPEIYTRVVYQALHHTSKAIIFTSLALIFGFMVIGFSSFLPIKYFSLLVALTMVNATWATLMFLPAVILIFPALVFPGRKKSHAGKVHLVPHTES